jgi:ribonucrease Y
LFEHWWLWALVGILIGGVVSWLMARLTSRRHLRQAEEQAQDLIHQAEEIIREKETEYKERFEEDRQQALSRFEKENRKFVQKNQETEERLQERQEDLEAQFQTREQARNRQDQILRSRQGRIQGREGQVRGVLNKATELAARYREELLKRTGSAADAVKSEITARLEQETRNQAVRLANTLEEESEVNLEREAKRIIRVALSRFARPYCSERGIGNVTFEKPEIRDRTFGPERKFLRALEKACGVDISFNDEYQSASILGYDPVRRELGRMSLEKMAQDRNLTEEKIDGIVQNCKKDLFKKIITDGNRVARELRVEGLSEEIRHMMGALRYRYSFAQNQHFHCAEVGFLCGLLSSELGVDIKDGRRSGLLHDIGKAMDHSKEGGHAVIGAEFIEQHGEKPNIVHAVRAHHFDETPSTDLAYLVIAADAISGARPGARRSTADSYTQKIADLQKIGDSFDGVVATYILSAGREVRVIVDSDRVDDHNALELSKQIARKIEEECSYPGLIKLTVVRETQAVEMAK